MAASQTYFNIAQQLAKVMETEKKYSVASYTAAISHHVHVIRDLIESANSVGHCTDVIRKKRQNTVDAGPAECRVKLVQRRQDKNRHQCDITTLYTPTCTARSKYCHQHIRIAISNRYSYYILVYYIVICIVQHLTRLLFGLAADNHRQIGITSDILFH